MTKINKIKTAKGKDGIAINDFRYGKDKTLVSGEISWRCTNRNCSASLRTDSAVTCVKQTHSEHNHNPADKYIPSSPLFSEPSTPTPLTPEPQTLTPETATLPEMDPPSLTELLSPYVTLTPEPPKFPQLDEENKYLRQKLAELKYTNQALTDRLIDVEKRLLKLDESETLIAERTASPPKASDTGSFKHTGVTKEANSQTNVVEKKISKEVPENVLIDAHSTDFGFLHGIHVLEANTGDFIDTLKHNKFTAFAHSIMTLMTNGACQQELRPGKEDCLTENLAYQQVNGAPVYSLLTKPKDFLGKGFKTLICSPMGCVRDFIKIDNFARKIAKFQIERGANILIVTKHHKANRKLRHGLNHYDFIKQLRRKIENVQEDCERRKREEAGTKVEEATNDTQTSDWYNLSDGEMKMYLDQIQVPGNANRIDLSVSHFLKINPDREDTVKMRNYVLAAVNNREDETREGGTHWSLLVYTRESNTYYHLDSVEPLNRPHAQRLAVALSGDPDVNVVQIQCRQQKSGVECGAYVVHYTELICSMIVNNISIKVTSNKVISKVTLLSDSHSRNLRHLLQNQLGENCEVYSVVKSSGKSEHIVSDLGGHFRLDFSSGEREIGAWISLAQGEKFRLDCSSGRGDRGARIYLAQGERVAKRGRSLWNGELPVVVSQERMSCTCGELPGNKGRYNEMRQVEEVTR
ncbi:hypothetical protein J6590_006713 [Homalodisca vitripennis]|nr:hypothetical protein J6590_006713 [Homalodisca vitripennis]